MKENVCELKIGSLLAGKIFANDTRVFNSVHAK